MTGTGAPRRRVLEAGPRALLVEVASTAEAVAVYAAARAGVASGAVPEVTDLVPGARTVLLDGVRPGDAERVRRWLEGVVTGTPSPPAAPRRRVEVPTVYDGEDLRDVARLWGMTAAEVVATHTGTDLVVAFCGFAPGFAYCTGLPERLAVPRLASPRPRVPAGSVAVAGPFTGVYPTASPGGWRLLGRTALRLWDPASPEPATLAPGTLVRFVEVPG